MKGENMNKSDALEIVLASYRDTYGVRTERGNEIHRLACEEVLRLRNIEENAKEVKVCPVCRGTRQDPAYLQISVVCHSCNGTGKQ